MVRLEGELAKPPEKRFNYKNCFDELFRVRVLFCVSPPFGVGPNVFRAVLMNASQLVSYDFFKAELLKTAYFEDNIMRHFTASFAAVRTVATTVCSTADVLKLRIMNASGPASISTVEAIRTALKTEEAGFIFKGWVPVWTRHNDIDFLDVGAVEEWGQLVEGEGGYL
ncbi:hypothetical protein B0H19DRAFT_1285978 [Mycena capillaripes]|nr:hypothetical protein B0H19DRAFT_1285978 [Mycena capillaripes]